MIEWLTFTQVAIALAAGVLCLVLGLARRTPGDLTMGATALVALLLIAQLVVSAVAPSAGNHPRGSLLEYWMYQIAIVLVPLIAMAWALIDRTRWSVVVLGVAGLAVSVMLVRMWTIWTNHAI
ncbi:hypothetical protein ACFOYW_06750 [Gryllotalpicola reticulitermitis]|uniref:Integral membrane protein n=1 Tax=Gryllotalpicola reticulitermitis TaxID=1184153 RepID=A0ABV8Q6F5_9MICO